MPAEIVTIPCLSDNYAFLLRERASGEVALVDAPEAGPILADLDRCGWRLGQILLTHHHADHVQGVAEIRAATGARVLGAERDAHRLPPLDHALVDGSPVAVGALEGVVLDVPGHTLGHIAFHFPAASAVFTADSLMALGCGRLFEGTPEMMWNSLRRLAALPPSTLVCSGHEYTLTNAKFALTIEPDNPKLISRAEAVAAARAEGRPTVPSLLSEEQETNPFLRAHLPKVKAALGMSGADDVAVFAEIRRRKDAF